MNHNPIMKSTALTIWRVRHRLNAAQASRELGVTPKTFHRYEMGLSQIPAHVALACLAIELGRSKEDARRIFAALS